jgi:hypothetical protein
VDFTTIEGKMAISDDDQITSVMLGALHVLFKTHPEPHNLRDAWIEMTIGIEEQFRNAGETDLTRSAGMLTTRALLNSIPKPD